MYPDSERGFAPAIHGVALSNAKVQIRQNNIVIYDTVVPPGPFDITDLYPTGFGGDLVVSVTESDGSVRTFNVPFSATPMALREGRLRYSLILRSRRSLTLCRTLLISIMPKHTPNKRTNYQNH